MSEQDANDKQESPWVILNCPSCEKKIKLPREKMGSAKFKCPLCLEKISVSAPIDPVKPSEAAPTKLQASAELVAQINPSLDDLTDEEEAAKKGFLSRIKTTNDDVGKEDGEVIEKDGQTLMKRRRRVRKKKKVDSGPDWESEAGAGEPEDRDEEYSYAVDTEVDEDGNMMEVRRRVKPENKKTAYEKFSSSMVKVFWVFSAVTGIVLIGAVVFLVRAGQESENKDTEIVVRDIGEITTEITAEAFAVIEKYVSANTWTEQVQLVRNPTKVRPLMEAYYERRPYAKKEGASVIEQDGVQASRRQKVLREEQSDVLDMIFVAVEFKYGDFQYFALERKRIMGTDNKFEYLIDWAVSERYRPTPVEQFKDRAIPGSTAEFRVSLQAQGTYFVLPFDDPGVWRCYHLSYPGDPDFDLFGYTKKGTEADQKVLDLFSVSGRPAPIIKVALPEGKVFDPGAVEIIELIQTTWFD